MREECIALHSVAYLVRGGAFRHRQAAKESERFRIRREGGCGERDSCEKRLIRHSLIALLLLLLSQESFQKILAFSFEVLRLGRAFE